LTLGFTTRTRRGVRRKWAVLGGAVAVLMLLGASVALANLPGSTFDGGNGLILPTNGTTDWAVNPPNLHTGTDLPSGSGDNAFGQGTKEDNAAVTIVSGSIPPNKNDLTQFGVASESKSIGGVPNQFLYLAWERAVNIGNANLDFEINQAGAGFTASTTGAVTITRTAGDLLVTYDFSGSGKPTIGLNIWLTSASVPVITGFSTNTCLASNSFPCWGDHKDMSGAGLAEAGVNTAIFNDTVFSHLPSLGIGLFGEAAINLTAAGVFPPGKCEVLGTVFVKSRSSSSFGAELKDFIAPIAVGVNTCGTIVIKKVTVPSSDTTTSFQFTTTGGIGTAGFSLTGGSQTTYTGVFPGSANSVNETVPAGWDLTSATCDNGNVPGTNITVVANGTTTCTFTDTEQGHIIIKKLTDPSSDTTTLFTYTPSYNSGATFQLKNLGSNDSGALVPGAYTVNESTIPAGWNFSSVSCADTGGLGSTGTPNGTTKTQVDITLTAGDTITCTYKNAGLGSVKIVKETVNGFGAFDFTSTGGAFTLTTTKAGVNGEDSKQFDNLAAGSSFTATETIPGNYDLTSLTCNDGTSGSTSTGAVTVTVPLNGLTTCTYVDTARLGAIKVSKTSIKGATALAGVTFDVSTDAADTKLITTLTTGADGTACVAGLVWSGTGTTYYVTEKSAPAGYSIDKTSATGVPVTQNGTCGSGHEATASFTDSPLTDLVVTVTSEVSGAGGTQSTITCVDSTPAAIGNSPQGPTDPVSVTANGLKPGTYTCTVLIDP
jgi:Prealbumin-like fold domain